MYKRSEYKNWTIKQYREHLQKTSPEGQCETYVGKTIRFFSIFLTKILAHTKLTPNMITSISVLIFMTGISLFIFDSIKIQLVGVLLIYISVIFDASDGEIARLKGNKSGVGGFYTEPVSHDIQYAFMFFPLTLGQYLAFGDVKIVYVGFIGLASKILLRSLSLRFLLMKQRIAATTEEPLTIEDAYRRVGFAKKIFRVINREIFSSVGMVTPLIVFTVMERLDLFIWSFAIVWLGIFVMNFLNQIVYVYQLSK